METKRLIRVYSPDKSFYSDLTNIPPDCTAKQFIDEISKIPDFHNLKINFKIKKGDGYLADDDFITEDVIYLINEEDTFPKIFHDFKLVTQIVFYLVHFISLLFIIFHHALYGLIFYTFGSFLFFYFRRMDPEHDSKANNIVDGIRLFFVSLVPGFELADAAIHEN